MAVARYLGVDLAWREDQIELLVNETGVAAIDSDGQVLDAGWTHGVEETIAWANAAADGGDALMFVDAPLVVHNDVGQRLCETQVGQRYGRWKVSANTTNTRSPRLAGVSFLRLADQVGWRYSDGRHGPQADGWLSRRPIPTPRWSARQNLVTTPSGPATSASRHGSRLCSGGLSVPRPATL